MRRAPCITSSVEALNGAIFSETIRIDIFSVEKDQVLSGGKQRNRVHARSVAAHWAISYLGLTATAVGRDLGLSKSAVSRAAERGRCLVADQALSLEA